MTHEYVIALGGRIEPHPSDKNEAEPTAIAWAADRVLAVGPDEVVRAISRGDSTFLDVSGCVVTALPDDPARADAEVRDASGTGQDLGALLIERGLLDSSSALETGSLADLAFWDTRHRSPFSDSRAAPRLVAVVRSGAFIEGDERRGPFPDASDS